jgi:hypothetical protein
MTALSVKARKCIDGKRFSHSNFGNKLNEVPIINGAAFLGVVNFLSESVSWLEKLKKSVPLR